VPFLLHRRIFVAVTLCAIIIFSFGVVPKYSFGDQQATTSTGALVPLYSYPGQSWQTLAQAKEAYPSVPVVAIINPVSGPGSYQDPNFVSGIQMLQSAGVTLVGYVATDFGALPLSQVEQEIYTYSQYYSLSGIFFDQMASVSGYESYYSALSAYASSLGYRITFGNPGTPVPASYIGTVSNIVIYENSGLPSANYLSSLGYPKSDFSMISYGVSTLDSSFVQSAVADVNYLYVTDGVFPNPHGSLSSYFSSLLASLCPNIDVTVDSFDTWGNQIPGLYVTIQANGAMVATGYTPFTFQATPGDPYTITIWNYANDNFAFWATGAYSQSVTIMPTTSSELAAFYLT
jgi:Spherulation-specific family 4